MTPALSIIVPMHDEHAIAARTLERLVCFAASRGGWVEIVVVDDHSEPPMDLVDDRCATDVTVRVVRNDGPRGKGAAVAFGMLAARGNNRVFLDADLAYPPEEITKIVHALEDSDVAVGSRLLPTSRVLSSGGLVRSRARRVMSHALGIVVRGFLLPKRLDTQAGLKGFTADAAEKIFRKQRIHGFAFDLECLYVASRLGLRIVEVGVDVHVDHRESSVHVVRDSLRMVRDMMRIRSGGRAGAYDDD